LLAVKDNKRNATVIRTSPQPIRLRSYDRFHLEIHHEFRVVTSTETSRAGIQPIGYQYELNDAGGNEILAYHYHPMGTSPVTYPHLHAGQQDARLAHGKKHLPTGLVTLQQVIHCLITEFDVPPLRQDWADILAAGHSTIDAEGSI
jgi:hypothetical protein